MNLLAHGLVGFQVQASALLPAHLLFQGDTWLECVDAFTTSYKVASIEVALAAMLLLGIFFSAALLFLVPISAIPLNSRTLNPAYVSPSHFDSTNPIPNLNPDTLRVVCSSTRAGLNLTAVAEDCSTILNVILRLDGPFENRAFSQQHYMNSMGHWVPARWDFGQCSVYAYLALSASADLFTFFEVALTANKILSDCVMNHKKGQGGFMSIGSPEKSFYVGVQGHLPSSNDHAINDTDISAVPDLEVSKRRMDAKRTIRSPTGLQWRIVDSRGKSVPLENAISPSNPAGNPKAMINYDIECFPIGSRLPSANGDDCKFIINSIILGMRDPFRVQTWGYTDAVDINLSLPENRWIFKNCLMRVKNIDEKQVDSFRPVDVAEAAQAIVQTCIVGTKEALGGTAEIGQLKFPRTFYVVVSGTERRSVESQGNDSTLSLPSNKSRTLESRASLTSPEGNPLSLIPTEGLKAGKRWPVNCFDPAASSKLKHAVTSDCTFIIDEIILRLANPMKEQNFGYTDADDINLTDPENSQWIHGQCVVYIRGLDGDATLRDRFRFVDVALTAHRILEDCVQDAKYAIGGIADVGTREDRFYVGVAGMDSAVLRNGTILELPSSAIPASPSRNRTESIPPNNNIGADSANLEKRATMMRVH